MTVDRGAVASATQRADAKRTAETIRVLMEVSSAADAVVARVLAEFEVTASAAGLLWTLAPGTEPPTLRDIAAHLHCDPSTVSLTADKLQGIGLITRQPHPTDGRKRTVALTERGRELWEALSTRLHASGVLAGLDADEQRTLHALLTKIRPPQRP